MTPRQVPERRPQGDLTDEELDRYILARLAIVGVDLSVLPDDDPSAPVDRARVLRSARSFLRSTVRDISALQLDPGTPPVLYPAALAPKLEDGRGL